MLIDGHAHIYAEKSAEKILTAFTQLHRMESTASVGAGTAADLLSRMDASHIDYTVLANFAPVKRVERTNEWTLSVARERSGLIPLISVYPGMPVEQVKNWFRNGAKGIRQIGCERITFGSDYPFGNPAGDIRRIKSLALTDEEKQMILGENSRRLYFSQSDEPGG